MPNTPDITYGPGEDRPRDRRGRAGLGLSSQGQRVTTRDRVHTGRDLPALLPGAATRGHAVYVQPDPDPDQV